MLQTQCRIDEGFEFVNECRHDALIGLKQGRTQPGQEKLDINLKNAASFRLDRATIADKKLVTHKVFRRSRVQRLLLLANSNERPCRVSCFKEQAAGGSNI